MPIQMMGRIVVPVAGTPVSVRTAVFATGERFQAFHAMLFQAMATNTGRVYIGKNTMVKATLADCAAVLAIPTANTIPSFGMSNPLSPAGVDISGLFIDADVNGEGVLLTILTT